MSELDELMSAFGEAGGERGVLGDLGTAHLVASGRSILSSRTIEGIDVQAQETRSGIDARMTVRTGVIPGKPIHLCFGVLPRKGTQKIRMHVKLEKGASAHFIAHCLFPNAEKVKHCMDADVILDDGAEMRYSETHYHGPYGGTEVVPRLRVKVGSNARYVADFTLITGRAGKLDIDYDLEAGENAVAELVARVFGHADDEIRVKEKIILNGRNSRGLVKARIAIEDEASAEVRGITEGNAAGARGHVDCMEIVKDHAVAKAVPIVRVNHPEAKVTHEAAIGSVDRRQMETLMAHGLTPEEAVDMIVKGMLA